MYILYKKNKNKYKSLKYLIYQLGGHPIQVFIKGHSTILNLDSEDTTNTLYEYATPIIKRPFTLIHYSKDIDKNDKLIKDYGIVDNSTIHERIKMIQTIKKYNILLDMIPDNIFTYNKCLIWMPCSKLNYTRVSEYLCLMDQLIKYSFREDFPYDIIKSNSKKDFIVFLTDTGYNEDISSNDACQTFNFMKLSRTKINDIITCYTFNYDDSIDELKFLSEDNKTKIYAVYKNIYDELKTNGINIIIYRICCFNEEFLLYLSNKKLDVINSRSKV